VREDSWQDRAEKRVIHAIEQMPLRLMFILALLADHATGQRGFDQAIY
jgi:hypothetical protein